MKKILAILMCLCLIISTLTVSIVSAEGWNPDVIDELTEPGTVSVTTLSFGEDEDQTPVYVKFTPSETGYYIAYSEAETDTYAFLYDSEGDVLCANDDYKEDYNFCLYIELTGGEVYYIEIFNYDGEDTFNVVIEQVDEDFVYDNGSDDGNDEDDYLTSGDYKYQILEDGTVEIKGYTGSATELEIPSEIDGKVVTSIGSWAFEYCESLTSITIPDSVTSIGWGAFRGCISLTSITIPNSITSIGIEAFYNTGYYNNEDNWEDNVLYIGNCLINANSSISGSYTIKEGTKVIADGAFWVCTLLTSVTIPDGVISIGDLAFYACELLTSVTIPDSVISIGDEAFYDCESLTSVTIPHSVTIIGDGAFRGCISLNSIIVDKNNNIFDSRNNCNSIIETSENEIIAGCKNSIIPDSITNIGDYAFSGCTSLTSITIPDNVTNIGEEAFSDCASLTSVTIGNGVTSIDDYAFYCCKLLTTIMIPDNVTNIGEEAFGYIWNNSEGGGHIQINDFIIKGYPNSEAERYASDNDITFIALDGENPTQPTEPTESTKPSNPTQPTEPTAPSNPDPTKSTQPTSPTNSTQNTTKPTVTTPTTAKSTSKTVDTISFKAPQVKAKSAKGKITLTLKKVKGTAGYQVRYKVKGKWKVKTFKIKKNATKLIKNLKKGKYKVQLRLIDNAKKPLSNWSKVKTIKVK